MNANPGAYLIETAARFLRPDLQRHPGEAILIDVYVEVDQDGRGDEVEAELRQRIRDLVEERMTGVVPLINVTTVPGPVVSGTR